MNVTWTDAALDLLADGMVGLPLAGQRALAATVERVNRQLAESPLDLGEEREWAGPGIVLRFWYEPSLGVWFFVSARGVEVASAGVRPGR